MRSLTLAAALCISRLYGLSRLTVRGRLCVVCAAGDVCTFVSVPAVRDGAGPSDSALGVFHDAFDRMTYVGTYVRGHRSDFWLEAALAARSALGTGGLTLASGGVLALRER